MSENDDKCSLRVVIGKNHDKYDGVLYFKTINGEKVLDNVSFTVKSGDKIAFLADNEIAKTFLFQIIAGELEPDCGEIKWGTTISTTYFPKDNNYLFEIVD